MAGLYTVLPATRPSLPARRSKMVNEKNGQLEQTKEVRWLYLYGAYSPRGVILAPVDDFWDERNFFSAGELESVVRRGIALKIRTQADLWGRV